MATINATDIRQEGNVIYIKSDPAIGVLTLTSFVDDVSGETPPNHFNKSFRYTFNGVTWSDWQPLSTPTITAIPVQQKDTLIIELAYEKVPFDSTTLAVSEATITGNITVPEDGEYFKGSIFSEFFGSNDVRVLKWYVAVLEKLYERGLIPPFINRQNEQGLPDDFVDFWKSIAKFFGYLVVYARTYQTFDQTESLLAEYLEEHGMKTSINNTLDELQDLMQHFYHHVAERGTLHIIDEVENGATIDGEILRLIYFDKDNDEFLFNLYKPEHFGWNMGNSSPLHKGLYLNDNVNKSYETGIDVVDITKYPTTGTVSKVTDGVHTVLHINGAGGISASGALKYIKVDPRLDYEISFLIKDSDNTGNLDFGISAYDASFNLVDLKSDADGTTLNYFLQDGSIMRDDKYFLVRGFIYNKGKDMNADSILEMNQGVNLTFTDNVKWIIPEIKITSGTANIYAIRILPMQTEYSRGFIQVANFISCWLINNNNNYTIDQAHDYIVKYLINYNDHLKLTNIGEFSYNGKSTNDGFYWLPYGEYCEMTTWVATDPSCEIKYRWVADPDTAYCENI